MEKKLEDLFLDCIERNKDKLYRICRSYSSDEEDAKDLYQEVLLNIWKSLPTFKGNSKVDTWTFRIGLNVCLRSRHYSLKAEKQFISIESVKYHNLPSPVEDNRTEELAKLQACVKKLPAPDKSLILLYLEDLPYKEISAVTGISENHVAVKVKRIKEKLLTCFKTT